VKREGFAFGVGNNAGAFLFAVIILQPYSGWVFFGYWSIVTDIKLSSKGYLDGILISSV